SAKINVTGGKLLVQGPSYSSTPGLLVGQTQGGNPDFNTASVPGVATWGTEVQLFPIMADISRSVPGGGTAFQTAERTWGNNDNFFYEGQVFFPNSNGNGTGTLSFAEQNDDSTLLRIDGVTYINDTVWNVTNTSGPITLAAGWHDIDLRFSNGGGGA